MIHNPHLEGHPFYWRAGPVGILLSHGFTATTAEVRPLAKILHEHGYTIAGPLLPGHYTYPADLNLVRWQDWYAACEESYLRLKEDCEVVVAGGESTGGILALLLAARHPEVAAVLAYAPALRLAFSRWDQLRLRLMAPFIESVPKGNMDGSQLWQGYPVNPLKGAVQLLNLQGVVRGQLSRVTQPLLVVQGRLDTTVHPGVPAELAEQVSSQIKEVHWMEKSSHVVIIDQEYQHVAELTLRFLNRVLKPARQKEMSS